MATNVTQFCGKKRVRYTDTARGRAHCTSLHLVARHATARQTNSACQVTQKTCYRPRLCQHTPHLGRRRLVAAQGTRAPPQTTARRHRPSTTSRHPAVPHQPQAPPPAQVAASTHHRALPATAERAPIPQKGALGHWQLLWRGHQQCCPPGASRHQPMPPGRECRVGRWSQWSACDTWNGEHIHTTKHTPPTAGCKRALPT